MKYESTVPGKKLNFIIGITRSDWVYCYGATYKKSTGEYLISGQTGEVVFSLDSLLLLGGTYYLDVRIRDPEDYVYDNIFSLIQFKVVDSEAKGFGIVEMNHDWIC